MKAQKFLVKESEIVIICIIYASLLWKKKDCSEGLQFLLKVLETKMFLILSAKWPENLAEKETRMSSEFLYRTMFTRKNPFFYGGCISIIRGESGSVENENVGPSSPLLLLGRSHCIQVYYFNSISNTVFSRL